MNSKTSINYTKAATSEPTAPAEPTYAEQFSIGPHQVAVVVDEDPQNSAPSSLYEDRDGLLIQSRRPVNLSFCPKCSREHVRTRTRTHPNFVTWILAGVTGALCFPLFWIPLVVDAAKQTDHYCQNCGQKLGTIKPLEGCCVKEEE